MEGDATQQDGHERPEEDIAAAQSGNDAGVMEGSSRQPAGEEAAAAPSRSPSYSPSLASSRRSGSRSQSPHRSPARRSRSRSLTRSPTRSLSPRDERAEYRRREGSSRSASPVPRGHDRRDTLDERHDGRRRRRDSDVDNDSHRTSTSIEVRGLPKMVFGKHLEHIFGCYGRIVDVIVPTFARSGESRGRAHVVFSSIREAVDAVEHMHGGQIDGVIVDVVQRQVPRGATRGGHVGPDRRDAARMMPRAHRGYDDRYSGRAGRGDRYYDDRERRGGPHYSRDDYNDRRPPPPTRPPGHYDEYASGPGDEHMHPSRRQMNSASFSGGRDDGVEGERKRSSSRRSPEDTYRRSRDRSMSWTSHSRSPEGYR